MPAALVVACLLLFQSTLGVFAGGAAPAVVQLDAFGNVICTQSGAVKGAGGDRQQHIPACCTLGCSMASTAYSPPADIGLEPVRLQSETVAFASFSVRDADITRERSPANPRAPPLFA